MWVVIHKEKMSIFAGYVDDEERTGKEKAMTCCQNLNSVKEGKYYMDWVNVR